MNTKHTASNQRVRDSEFPHPICLCKHFGIPTYQSTAKNGINDIKNFHLNIHCYVQ